MIRSILVLSLLLGTALAPGAALAEGGATGVTPIKVEEGKAIEVTGNKWNHCIPCTRRYQAERKHGVPRGTYVALWERQRGKCLCCGDRLQDATRRAPHIDHCHQTGRIRGMLCHYCNTALGMVRESRQNALALADYILTFCEPLKRSPS